jgi:spore coat polysaccharide biosynthesis protein SpsF (cytidylyltransferase family)
MKNITAIIQARLGSTRLPGKTLMTIEGDSLLGHLVRRVKASKYVENIIIATTTKEKDNAIVNFAKNNNLRFYRGSEEDVLDRFYKAAIEYNVETIVRVTPDCPLLDSKVMDLVISKYLEGDYDFVCNTMPPTYPDGLDTEVFSFKALEKAWREAKKSSEREHVTPYIYNHPEFFKIYNCVNDIDYSGMRWVVDEEVDCRFVTEVYKHLYRYGEMFYMDDILDLLSKHPELNDINRNIKRNEGYKKSLNVEKKQE